MMVKNQIGILFYALVAGIVVAFIYDLFRIKRKVVKSNVIIIALEDLIYWIIASIVLFLSIYASNDGELRGFAVIGFFSGALLYFLLLSRTVTFILIKILKAIKNALTKVFYIVLYPFKTAIKSLTVPSKKAVKLLTDSSKKLYHKKLDLTKGISVDNIFIKKK